MITINITSKIRVVHLDDLNYCMQRLKVRGEKSKNPGEEYWDNEYYYPTLGMACADIARILADEHGDSEAIDSLESYSRILHEKCKDVEAAVESTVSGATP